jgi:hypothetical protein
MRRVGHSTARAAMRYQHSTDRQDQEIAAEMSRRLAWPVRTSESRGEHMARQARPIDWLGLFPLVETRGIEPLTPALQRRCSAN